MNQTRTVEAVDREIAELQQQLKEVRGTTTEVYTRIVGYYRSVANWNKGKREEYEYRKLFSEPEDMIKNGSRQPEFAVKEIRTEPAEPAGENAEWYTFFSRKSCPNCPPVRDYLKNLSIPGNSIDVETPEGMDAAIEHQVLASPTVIFFDVQGHEVFRAHNTETIEKAFSGAEVGIS